MNSVYSCPFGVVSNCPRTVLEPADRSLQTRISRKGAAVPITKSMGSMPKLKRRQTRTVRRLAKALAALDEQAAVSRPRPPRLLRTPLGVAR